MTDHPQDPDYAKRSHDEDAAIKLLQKENQELRSQLEKRVDNKFPRIFIEGKRVYNYDAFTNLSPPQMTMLRYFDHYVRRYSLKQSTREYHFYPEKVSVIQGREDKYHYSADGVVMEYWGRLVNCLVSQVWVVDYRITVEGIRVAFGVKERELKCSF